jgi:hypothetical protein
MTLPGAASAWSRELQSDATTIWLYDYLIRRLLSSAKTIGGGHREAALMSGRAESGVTWSTTCHYTIHHSKMLRFAVPVHSIAKLTQTIEKAIGDTSQIFRRRLTHGVNWSCDDDLNDAWVAL